MKKGPGLKRMMKKVTWRNKRWTSAAKAAFKSAVFAARLKPFP
jgi:hypothetical protein